MQVKKQQLEPDMEQQTGSKLGKEYINTCILSPGLLNLHAEYIMQNARRDESRAGIKSSGRNINNLRYADDTTLMAESEEELKSLLMKVKEESEKSGLKLNIQKTKIMAASPITSWQIVGGKKGNSDRLFLGAVKSLQMMTAAMKIKRCLLLGRKALTNLDSILRSRNITLPTKVCQSYGFSSSHDCESWTIKKVKH